MAWYKVRKSVDGRTSKCQVSISNKGILSVNKGAILAFKFHSGKIELVADDEDPAKLGFRYVDENSDEDETVVFREQTGEGGKVMAYQASFGFYLKEVMGELPTETTAYDLHYDQSAGLYYFLLSTGKVTGRKRGANDAKTEVKKVLEASSASAETDGAGDAEAAA